VRLWGGHTTEAVEAARGAISSFHEAGDLLSHTQATFLLARALVASGAIAEAFEVIGGAGLEDTGGALSGNNREAAALGLTVHTGADVADLDAVVGSLDRDVDPAILGQSDNVVSLALALVQADRAAEALPLLATVRAARSQPSMYGASVEALAHAALGDAVAARAAAVETIDGPATYLDRLTARLALTALAASDPDAVRSEAEALVGAADASTDPVMQAVARLAAATALTAAGLDAAELHDEGRQRLEAVGIEATGWLRAVESAIAANAGATAAPSS
jgi:hypothetical protein